MRFIENQELREWVKESLRKTIFQKAHALAVQTGCDILVKLKDSSSHIDCPLYYASDSIQEVYRKDGVKEEPGEMFVSGETGLPIFPRVDCSTQSTTEERAELRTTGTDGVDADDGDTPVPMQLALTCDSANGGLLQAKEESQSFTTQTSQDLQNNSLSDVVVKLERIDNEELNASMGAAGDMGEQSQLEDQGAAFPFDNSVTFPAEQEDPGGGGGRPYPMMSPKPYQCGVCGKAFRTVQVLQKHTQTFHMRPQMTGARSRGGRGRGLYHGRPGVFRQQASQQARYLCVMCNRSFRSPDLLQDHMTRSHMSQVTPVQLSQSQAFDPSSAQTSQAPATATLSSLQQQQQIAPGAAATFQSPDEASQMQMTQQSDPSAFPVSAAPATAPSTFASPAPTAPMFKYQQVSLSAGASTSAVSMPQSTPSPSRVFGSARRKTQTPAMMKAEQPPVPITKVMTAILRTTGPVLTHIAVRRNGAPVFRKVSTQLFKEAAGKLQESNLGTLIEMKLGGGKPSVVFIKKPPPECEEILLENPELVSAIDYSQRYYSPMLSSIPPTMAGELLAKGLVPPQFF